MQHFCPIAEPSGRVPPRGGAGSRQCLCWTPSSTISSRYHPTLRSYEAWYRTNIVVAGCAATTRRRHSVCKGGAPPGCRKNFTPRFFAGGLCFLRNFSAPSMGDRGRVAPRCAIPRRRGCASASSIGHLQNFQRLRAPLRARLRSPRATLAETARIRHLIEINRALGRTSPVSVRITCFPTV